MSIFQLPSAALARTVLGTIALIGSLVQPALAQVQPIPQEDHPQKPQRPPPGTAQDRRNSPHPHDQSF